jgi:hypothetical protein
MNGRAKDQRLNKLTDGLARQSQHRGLHSQTIIVLPGNSWGKNAETEKTGAGTDSDTSGLDVSPGSEVGYMGGKGTGIRIGDLMFGLGSYKQQDTKNIEKGSGPFVLSEGRFPFTEPRSAGVKEEKKIKNLSCQTTTLELPLSDSRGSLESREGVR